MTIFTIQSKSILQNKKIRKCLAVAFWLLFWQIACFAVKQEILIVSPVCVFRRLLELAVQSEFWLSAGSSMLRILLGFFIAVLAGTILAILTSTFSPIYDLFYPVISMIKATPVASFIILALVWLHSSQVPVFTAFLMVVPVVWANVSSGIQKTDRRFLQVAQVYHFGIWKTLKKIYIPSILPYFMAACTTGMGLAWKAGVAAEVLANTKFSVGGHIYSAKIYIETADLFAWTVVVIVMSVILERLMVILMKAFLKDYQTV